MKWRKSWKDEEEEEEEKEEEEEPDTVRELLSTHSTQSGWEFEKKYWNNFIPDFIPICWVKDIDLTVVSVLEIRSRVKCATPPGLYSRDPMSPIYLLWDSVNYLFNTPRINLFAAPILGTVKEKSANSTNSTEERLKNLTSAWRRCLRRGERKGVRDWQLQGVRDWQLSCNWSRCY